MYGSPVGYEFLRQAIGAGLPPLVRRSQIGAVTRIELIDGLLMVPRSVAPSAAPSFEAQSLNHLLFALRHEGTNLAILRATLLKIPAQAMVARLAETPSGARIRVACFLWESFVGRLLPVADRAAGSYAPVFDPLRYYTHEVGPTSTRWRVRFNGIGTLKYAVTIERSSEIESRLADKALERLSAAVHSLGEDLVRRTLEWAYLSETQGSFAIEGETPPQNKAQAFVALLREAHQKRPLDEGYLCQLQRAALTNPALHEFQFRSEQNWLRRGGRGALSVTYVPPAPTLALELMTELMALANRAPPGLCPLMAAAVVSFGFVFLHPFMDGNGRLSRFLIHHMLCGAGALSNGFVLPISAAIHRHEDDYLKVLSAFSTPARQLWAVTQIDAAQFDFQFQGDDGLYRYWDATAAVAFTLRMASEAVDVDVLAEAKHLRRFDTLFSSVSAQHDLRGNDLATLLTIAIHEGGISANKRKRYAQRVPVQAMDMIEALVRASQSQTGDQPPG